MPYKSRLEHVGESEMAAFAKKKNHCNECERPWRWKTVPLHNNYSMN